MNTKLNPKIWNDFKLKEDVEKKLLEIVKEFISYVSVPINVVDVQIVGSNASFNYKDDSDLDVHIVANLECEKCDSSILMTLYNEEKSKFNEKYDIKIHGIDVELYVEDVRSGAISNGIYSLLRREWVKVPQQIEEKEVDVSKEVYVWKNKINKAIEDNSINDVKKLLNTIYLVRKNSIAVDGEYGKGNLIFKGVRSLGLIDRLKNASTALRSKELSLEALHEDTRVQLIDKSKSSPKGRQRFNRRTKSSISTSVSQYNEIDMNKLFKDNILTVGIRVHGETDDYTVTIKFGGFLDFLNQEVSRNRDILDLRSITVALVKAFNSDNVYIRCSCPDFWYRYSYISTKDDTIAGTPQWIPAPITNPNDSLGSGCKHILLVLSNSQFLVKIASVINNYVKYMERSYKNAYATVIYPAIYRKKYEEPVQTSVFDKDELETDKETIDVSNKQAVDRSRFQQGNKQGIRFAPKDQQISIEDITDDEE